MKNKTTTIALILLSVSVYLSMDNNGWDWLGGIALILGVIAIYNNIRR